MSNRYKWMVLLIGIATLLFGCWLLDTLDHKHEWDCAVIDELSKGQESCRSIDSAVALLYLYVLIGTGGACALSAAVFRRR